MHDRDQRRAINDERRPPKYDVERVAEVLLREAIEQHPTRLTADELIRRIVADPGDTEEIRVAGEAILELHRSTLIRYDDEKKLVVPTQAALRAHELLIT